MSGVTRTPVPEVMEKSAASWKPSTRTWISLMFSSTASVLSSVSTFGRATKLALPRCASALTRASR